MFGVIWLELDWQKQRIRLFLPLLEWWTIAPFFFRQNKPMKSEIEEFCFRREKDACVQVGDVIPGGRYRQLLYPVMAYVHWSWSWRYKRESPLNSSTPERIFKCRELSSFSRVENFIILPLGVFHDWITTSFVCLTHKFLFPCGNETGLPLLWRTSHRTSADFLRFFATLLLSWKA